MKLDATFNGQKIKAQIGIVPTRCSVMTACRVFAAAQEIVNIKLMSD